MYVGAGSPWRHGRAGMGALLKADLFRESVDGEALDWACARLAHREESRKILIVISDGCPMDGATDLANDKFYLDNHLKQVVRHHEQRAEVEVCALGVGLDLSPYFSHCQALDLSVPLGNRVLGEIISMIGRRTQR